MTIALVAKECRPGRVKTRLTPPLTHEQGARLAQASLDDTMRTLAALPAARRILFFQGATPPAAADLGFDVVPQPEGGLNERLGHLFDLVDAPTVLIGMDTPQLAASHLAGPLERWGPSTDAWLGLAEDGGFWALALRRPDGALLRGVPMSRDDTGARQADRLRENGLRTAELPTLRDVDTASDALEVAALVPGSEFARVCAELTPALRGETRP